MRIFFFLMAWIAVQLLQWSFVPNETWDRYRRIQLPLDAITGRCCWLLLILISVLIPNPTEWYSIAIGLMMYLAGQILIILAVRANPYFSPAIVAPPVIIQSGIYRYLKHPAYMGHALSASGIWLIWSSLWALPMLFGFTLILDWRANKENALLQASQ